MSNKVPNGFEYDLTDPAEDVWMIGLLVLVMLAFLKNRILKRFVIQTLTISMYIPILVCVYIT